MWCVMFPLSLFRNQAQIEEKAFRSEKALEQKIEAALEAAPAGSIEASALVRNESPSRSPSK